MGARNRPEMPYGWGRVGYSLEERLPWMNLPFEVSEYHQRIERLRGHMAQNGLDAIVVVGNRADNSNVRYLSNFEDFYGGESIVVVPAVGSPGFTTNAIMHGEPMHSGIQDCWIENARCAAAPRTVTGDADPVTIFDHVEDFINEGGAGNGRIGIVGEFNVGQLEAFLKGRFPNATIKHAPTILYAMRAIKSPAEIAVMRKACHLADVGLKAVMDAVSPGVSEFDLSAEANYAMFKAGSEHPAFAIAVAAGARSGFKHVAPTANKVKAGDMVYVDLGGRYMGYYPTKTEVLQGTLDLMLLQTLAAIGPLHGYAIATRLEQVSSGSLKLNMGTLYPGLMRLEQRGFVRGKWGVTDNNRKARFYGITARGRRQLATERADWDRSVAIMHALLHDPS